jgi:3-isopropylmalate/(R)-2-methylmalate dehydratase small subunit
MRSDTKYSGRIWKLGDNISTDHILPSRYMTQVEPHELAAHCLAGVERDFSRKIVSGDILAAGDNIGYGSSREQAPQALRYAGISAIVAKSFARIFYRNCYNVGIPAIVCPQFVQDLTEGDSAEIDFGSGTIRNLSNGRTYTFIKPPEFLMEYIRLGGLIPYLEKMISGQ